MAGTIKGITVEIGGNTTKLGKALDNVNKKSRNLSSELGQINKLLKLDPGNADLLAQKQKVLAEAISNTGEKLKTLKAAEAQVQKQFEKGEASEEQVRELQREIIACTKKLDSYQKAAKQTADALDNLGDDSDDVGKGAKDVKKETDKASKSLDKYSDEADKAGKSSDGLGSKLKGALKAGLMAVATAATAAISAMVGSAEATRDYRTNMGKLDAAFKTSGKSAKTAEKTYKSLQGILGESDQAVEAANHLALLCDNEKDLAQWTGDIMPGIFATFGDSLPIEGLAEAANETAKVGKVTGPLADALNWAGRSEDEFNELLAKCSNEQERQTLIMETLTEDYYLAGKTYKETNAEVIRANEANEAWTESMAEVGAAIEPILTDVKQLGASLLSDLLPGIKNITSAFRGMLNGDKGAAENFGSALSGILTNLLQKIAELTPTLVQMAASLISNLATTIIGMIPDLLITLIGAVVSLIDSLATDILPAILQAITDLIPQLIAILPDLIMSIFNAITGENARILLEAVLDAVMSLVSNIDDLIAAILPIIPQIIMAVLSSIAENIPTILDAILELIGLLIFEVVPNIIVEIAKAIPQIIWAILQGLGKILVSIGTWFGTLFQKIGSWLGNIFKQIGDWFSKLVVKAKEGASQFVEKVVEFFKKLPYNIGYFLGTAFVKIRDWVKSLPEKAKEAGQNFVNGVVTFFKNLPGKISTFLNNVINKVKSWGPSLAAKGREGAKKLFNSIVNGIKSLPEKMKNIGKNIVEGVWNGIKNATSWIVDKVKSFAKNILKGIKDALGIKSPSRVFRDQVGKYIAEGIGVGITANADKPMNALKALGDEMANQELDINGATINRKLNTTFSSNIPGGNMVSLSTLISKLDNIYDRLDRMQIVLDTGALVGETIDKIDAGLATRQLLSARGV